MAVALVMAFLLGLSGYVTWMAVAGSDRVASSLVTWTRHRQLAAAIFAATLDDLEEYPWEKRSYSWGRGGSVPHRSFGRGSYQGAAYALIVSDALAGTGVQPGITDLFVRLSADGLETGHVMRVRFRLPTVLQPACYEVLHTAPIPEDPCLEASRLEVGRRIDDLLRQRQARAGWRHVLGQEIRTRTAAEPGIAASKLLGFLREPGLKERVQAQGPALEALAEGWRHLEPPDGVPDPEAADRVFERAFDLASPVTHAADRVACTARALLGRSRAATLLAEQAAAAAGPGSAGKRRDLLQLARSYLKQIEAFDPAPPQVPEALHQLARVEFLLDPIDGRREAERALESMVARHPGHHLGGESPPTTAEDSAATLVRHFRTTMEPATWLPSASYPHNLWAVTASGDAPFTILPRFSDSAGTGLGPAPVEASPDGTRVGVGLVQDLGGRTEHRVLTLDFDGSHPRLVRTGEGGTVRALGWVPSWTARYLASQPATSAETAPRPTTDGEPPDRSPGPTYESFLADPLESGLKPALAGLLRDLAGRARALERAGSREAGGLARALAARQAALAGPGSTRDAVSRALDPAAPGLDVALPGDPAGHAELAGGLQALREAGEAWRGVAARDERPVRAAFVLLHRALARLGAHPPAR